MPPNQTSAISVNVKPIKQQHLTVMRQLTGWRCHTGS
jgi:hypothetical protein